MEREVLIARLRACAEDCDRTNYGCQFAWILTEAADELEKVDRQEDDLK